MIDPHDRSPPPLCPFLSCFKFFFAWWFHLCRRRRRPSCLKVPLLGAGHRLTVDSNVTLGYWLPTCPRSSSRDYSLNNSSNSSSRNSSSTELRRRRSSSSSSSSSFPFVSETWLITALCVRIQNSLDAHIKGEKRDGKFKERKKERKKTI